MAGSEKLRLHVLTFRRDANDRTRNGVIGFGLFLMVAVVIIIIVAVVKITISQVISSGI